MMRVDQTLQHPSEPHVLNMPSLANAPAGLPQVEDLSHFIEILATLPLSGRSDEEIEQQIRDERDAWE